MRWMFAADRDEKEAGPFAGQPLLHIYVCDGAGLPAELDPGAGPLSSVQNFNIRRDQQNSDEHIDGPENLGMLFFGDFPLDDQVVCQFIKCI